MYRFIKLNFAGRNLVSCKRWDVKVDKQTKKRNNKSIRQKIKMEISDIIKSL
jgi:hypothetical protein